MKEQRGFLAFAAAFLVVAGAITQFSAHAETADAFAKSNTVAVKIPSATFLTSCMDEAGVAKFQVPERMTAAGAVWIRLCNQFAVEGETDSVRDAFVSYFKKFYK